MGTSNLQSSRAGVVMSKMRAKSAGATVRDGLVGWLEFNVPFQHKYGYIRDERGWVIYGLKNACLSNL